MSIESIETRVEKATEGPWELSPHVIFEKDKELVLRRPEQPTIWVGGVRAPSIGPTATTCILTHDSGESLVADGDFIAHSRQDIPALLNVARAAIVMRAKQQVVYDSPDYRGVWTVAQVHRGPYQGPTYIQEAEALDAALAELEAME